MSRRLSGVYPLLFLVTGLISLFVAEHEFQRRVIRDNADMRQDLQQAGVSRAEAAALLSAQTKLQVNASSYIEIAAFINLMLAITLAIPLYSQFNRAKLQ